MKKIFFIIIISFGFFSNSFASCYTQTTYNEFMRQWTTQDVCDFGTNYLPSYNPIYNYTPTYFAPSFFYFPEYHTPNYYYEPINYGFLETAEEDFIYGFEIGIFLGNLFW
jgi:hypothetical protein